MTVARTDDRIVTNISELTAKGAEFVRLPAGYAQRDFSGLPQNALERMVARPKISRLRAAWAGVATARGGPIVSHLPRTTAAVGHALATLRSTSPHLAFSFNFTRLPMGFDRRRLRSAFVRVDRFCVFSEYERQLYPRSFKLPDDAFVQTMWTQTTPVASPDPGPLAPKTYVSAVGGEGRDYPTLIRAAEMLPHIDFVIVARPHNIRTTLPANVRLLVNLPTADTWRIIADSTCTMVPLETAETCCGHITLVSTRLLGIPTITTRSEATREYTEGMALCEPSDHRALADLIADHHLRWEATTEAARARLPEYQKIYDRENWAPVIADFLADFA